ncbi:hypothetical protein ACFYWS_20600 [Streptomyces sp. NPDC002795]|uniref:hypothetical protein n=1 Tax=Streptomyces sp. NPDC002795 TaxID=3364665 RepID=UPI0036BD14D5
MNGEEEQPTVMKAVCHSEGCPVAEVEFVANMYANAEEPIYRAQCGQCGQPITDLAPAG